MKGPSKNVSASLRGQRQAGRDEMPIQTSRLKRGMSAGILPGERGVERPPGRMSPTSAANFADPIAKAGGS